MFIQDGYYCDVIGYLDIYLINLYPGAGTNSVRQITFTQWIKIDNDTLILQVIWKLRYCQEKIKNILFYLLP